MRNELIEQLTLDDLTGNAQDLAQTIGLDAFIRLVKIYGGTSNLYVPKAEELIKPVRDRLIRQEFNGVNIGRLARKWGLTDRYIREIVKEEKKKILAAPVSGQISLWE